MSPRSGASRARMSRAYAPTHVFTQLDAALEGAVLDLHGLITRAGDDRTRPVPGDRERLSGGCDLDRVGIDAGELDDDVEGGRVVRAEAVALRSEGAAEPGEAGHLPEVGEVLLDLAAEVVEVASMRRHGVA